MMQPDDGCCTAVKTKTVTLLILCSLAFAIGGSMWFTAIGFLDEVCEFYKYLRLLLQTRDPPFRIGGDAASRLLVVTCHL